jgi:uncharacterized protein (TIGR00255 family)
MIRSMTGFGTADGEVGTARVTVELRSVNHRFFNPTIKLPSQFARWENDVREAMRRGVTRGHVTLTARVEQIAGASDATIDEGRFAAYVARLRDLQQRYGLADALDVATILRLPNVVSSGEEEQSGTAAELVAIVERTVTALDEMRKGEGARLAAYISDRLGVIESSLHRIGERAPGRLVEQRDRMRDAIRELGEGVQVDEQRLAQEIAILVDRLDVHEELSRFHSHVAAFRETLRDASGEGVGKRLGFLLQEMLREANTTGSKGNDTAIVREVLVIKEELERIREQVENLE